MKMNEETTKRLLIMWRQFYQEPIEKLPLFKEFLIANGCKVGE